MRCGPVTFCAAPPGLLAGSWAAPATANPIQIAQAKKNPGTLFIISPCGCCIVTFNLDASETASVYKANQQAQRSILPINLHQVRQCPAWYLRLIPSCRGAHGK